MPRSAERGVTLCWAHSLLDVSHPQEQGRKLRWLPKHPAWCHRRSSGRALLGLVGLAAEGSNNLHHTVASAGLWGELGEGLAAVWVSVIRHIHTHLL